MFYEAKDIPPFKISHFPQQPHPWTLMNTETKKIFSSSLNYTAPSFLMVSTHAHGWGLYISSLHCSERYSNCKQLHLRLLKRKKERSRLLAFPRLP